MDDTNISSTRIRSDLYILIAGVTRFSFRGQIQLPTQYVCMWHCLCHCRPHPRCCRRRGFCSTFISVIRFYRLQARLGHVCYMPIARLSISRFGIGTSLSKRIVSFTRALCIESNDGVDVSFALDNVVRHHQHHHQVPNYFVLTIPSIRPFCGVRFRFSISCFPRARARKYKNLTPFVPFAEIGEEIIISCSPQRRPKIVETERN